MDGGLLELKATSVAEAEEEEEDTSWLYPVFLCFWEAWLFPNSV